MRKLLLFLLVTALIVVSGCLGQQTSDTQPTDTAGQEQAPTVNAITPVQNVEPDTVVNYSGNNFGVERVRIAKGDVIGFHNPTSWNHTLNIQSEPLFFTVTPGETVFLRFNRRGQYFGFCTIHEPSPIRISVE